MITPYKTQDSKKSQVRQMFDNIAGKYDFLNHFLSLGIDKKWRKKSIAMLPKDKNYNVILDLACGTGDFAFETARLNPDKIVGLDLSAEMLKIADKKKDKINSPIEIAFEQGDAENLPFQGNTFDLITVAFGVRNFEDLEKGLNEMHRVLKPGGIACILEFSKPTAFPIKQLYSFYFRKILPNLGKLLSKDSHAYTYLPDSVWNFPEGKKFSHILESVGFSATKSKKLSFGISTIYYGIKR